MADPLGVDDWGNARTRERGFTTWRIELTAAFKKQGESWDDIESSTFTQEQLDKVFYFEKNFELACPFTVWTRNRVYFPVQCDWSEGVASVSRNPNGKPTKHVSWRSYRAE